VAYYLAEHQATQSSSPGLKPPRPMADLPKEGSGLSCESVERKYSENEAFQDLEQIVNYYVLPCKVRMCLDM
jgi:hypothetical protein